MVQNKGEREGGAKGDLATDVAATALLVVEDTIGGGEEEETELAGGEEVVHPLLHVRQGDVEAGGDGAGLVEAAEEVDDDLAGAVIIDNLELANVACSGSARVNEQKILKYSGKD